MLAKEEALQGVKLFVLDMDSTVYFEASQSKAHSISSARWKPPTTETSFFSQITHPASRPSTWTSSAKWASKWTKAKS